MHEPHGRTYESDEEFFTDITNKFEFAQQEGFEEYLQLNDHEAYRKAQEQLERYRELRSEPTNEYAERAFRDSLSLSRAVVTYYDAKRNNATVPELPNSTIDIDKEWIPQVEQQFGNDYRQPT